MILVSFYSIKLLSWLLLFGTRIASLWSPFSHGSVLPRYYKNYGLVYVIDFNTNDLIFCLYNMHFRTLQEDCYLYSNTRSADKCDIVKYYHNFLITISGSSCYFKKMYDSFTSQNKGIHYTARVLARSFLQQVPGLRNRYTFEFGQPTVWEIHYRYWFRA